MSGIDTASLWTRLCQAGLAEGDQPPLRESAGPWFVQLMLGFAGWLCALFLLGFFALAIDRLMESSTGLLVLGSVLVLAAFGLYRLPKSNELSRQFAFALSLAGQAMWLFGLAHAFSSGTMVSIAQCMAAMEILLLLAIPDFQHRVFSAMAAGYALLIVLAAHGMALLIPGLSAAIFVALWFNEFRFIQHASLLRAPGYAVALMMPASVSSGHYSGLHDDWLLAPVQSDFSGSMFYGYLSPVLITFSLIFTAFHYLRRHRIPLTSLAGILALVGSTLAGLSAFLDQGIALGTLILVVGFGQGNRVLIGLGLLSLLTYLGRYYYLMSMSLLEKSMILVGSGFILILAYATMKWLLGSAHGESRNGT